MAASSSSEEQPREQPEPESESVPKPAGECVVLHKTKTVDFFGRSTPIILQNDNGPCPLLAICNVLLLKNQLNLSPDISEVSQEKLLSLVADRLIDSNSNVKNKDSGYAENQQQNIADAIDLLPRLTTGIDVNIKFRRIDDFEFTRECAIFDLLDIPLYHGWLVDPQDHETAEAIGSKSYNTIMSDLVSLETRNMKDEGKDRLDEDCIDFAAATAATLGVPSPNLSRAKSFDGSPRSISDQKILRKGDAQEEAELQRVFKLSENEASHMGDDSGAAVPSGGEPTMDPDKDVYHLKTTPEHPLHLSEGYSCNESLDAKPSFGDVPRDCNRNSQEEKTVSLNLGDMGERHSDELTAVESEEGSLPNDLAKCRVDTSMVDEATSSSSPAKVTVLDQAVESLSTSLAGSIDELDKQNGDADHGDSQLSSGRRGGVEAIDSFNSSLGGSEPIYEGEECIQELGGPVCEREPVYEGEMVLAELADKGAKDVSGTRSNDFITLRQGELISNFLKSNASQLTFYGLFSLQEGLNERELCVFFRNNHFSTMFKFKGELYLLATDQGFMNQPDLVWEKLNEVNGDTLFVTSNFKEFRLESSANGIWDERNAVASTADYLASIDSSGQASSNMNSDLQLAIALQQQEFEQQQPQRHATQQPSSNGSSRLITGPQAPRSSSKATSSSVRQEQKSKDKSSNCKLM